ncbi:histidine-specific methyltransferase [Xylaria bambusicola]|uniref:histidine-specific methyltransferase n=1 Tax=Xylaria bambusicola TaxID=326684 RepID=UPI002007F0F8|nr:histidine-specific methyltransferase [Xylaria bambusicola]KAI0521403.1 histidine-specific methyltransferase [Xylaria bambusicola]
MSQPMLLDTSATESVQLYSIRKSGLLNLKESIIAGLQATPKTLPSLLLWDDQGLQNFDAWTQAPDYYPKRCEWEILTNYQQDIASQLPTGSIIIELGCGNLGKTAWLLAAIERQQRKVHYYALDVSDDALYKNLGNLKTQFANSECISISGLKGTYDDCAEWLAGSAQLPGSTVTFLWLGNSIANLTKLEASLLIGQFRQACRKMSLDCNFLISADSCAVRESILKAYDPNDGPSRKFLLHGLHHANRLLGREVFKEAEWEAVPTWDEDQHELHYSYVPNVDVQFDHDQIQVSIKKGEPIHYFMSGKWTEPHVNSIAEKAGLKVGSVWKDTQEQYCFYLLHNKSYSIGTDGGKSQRALI